MNRYLPAAMALATSALVSPAARAQDAPYSLDGVWRTAAPIHYVVESTEEHPHGATVPHEGTDLVARTAVLKWTLREMPHGLVSGVNDWTAFDDDGNKLFDGSEPLLGAFDGERWLLAEPHDEDGQSARIVFEFKRTGPNEIRGVGYSVGGPKLLAMSFTLMRAE